MTVPLPPPISGERRTLLEAELAASVGWLIRLRWMAGVGVLAATWLIGAALHLRAPAGPLYLIGGSLLLYNFIFHTAERRLTRAAAPARAFSRLAMGQMALDWLAMTLLIHFSGGIESPAILYFIFHIVIASIFFPPRTAFAFALSAAALLSATAVLEYYALLPHEPVVGFLDQPLYRNGPYVAAVLFFFASTGLIVVYLAASIHARLRRREAEIVALSESLHVATQQLQALDETKSLFVRRVTHELRSPVTVTRTLLRTLAGGFAGAVSAQQQDMLNRASRRVDFLQKLIDDLLDLAAGKADLNAREQRSPVPLAAAVEKVIKRFDVPAREKGLALEWRTAPDEPVLTVLGTAEGLDRLFDNLISNAVKYTPSGGRVTVTLAQLENEARVTIEDTGIGIPAEALPHLFDEFYRAPNAKAVENEGTGLGLTIVKDIVARWGGGVGVENAPGAGVRVTVTLPLAA